MSDDIFIHRQLLNSGSPVGLDSWALIAAAVESILVTDTNLESPGPMVLFVNPVFESMTGWNKDEIICRSRAPATNLEGKNQNPKFSLHVN